MTTAVLTALCLATVASVMASESGTPPSAYYYPGILEYGLLHSLSDVNNEDAQVAIEMNFLRQEASAGPELKIKLTFLQDVETAAQMLLNKKLHGITMTSVDYLMLCDQGVLIQPIVISSKSKDAPWEPYVLVAQKGVGLEQLSRMKERRLMVEENESWDIGNIWLETLLHANGLPDRKTFFSTIQKASKPTRLVLPVFFGQAQACLVPKTAYDTMVELNPQIGQKLAVIQQSPGFIKMLTCIVDYLHPKFVAVMTQSIFDMHKSVDGQQLMTIFQFNRNFAYKAEYLKETEQVLRQYQAIKGSLKGNR